MSVRRPIGRVFALLAALAAPCALSAASEVEVAYGAANLKPGLNFEETVVTGRVDSSELEPEVASNVTFDVRLRGVDGAVVAATNGWTLSSGGVTPFGLRAGGLVAGTAYRAEVLVNGLKAGATLTNFTAAAVMGRELTNVLWGTRGTWAFETARTFDGEDAGTGTWSGRDYAKTADGMICVDTLSGGTAAADAALVFQPTNELSEAHGSSVASFRAIFTEASAELETGSDALFGLTVVALDGGEPAFACLSNGVWQVVPASVAAPALGLEYGVAVYANGTDAENGTLSYVVTDPSGRQTTLLNVALEGDLCELFGRVDVCGVGRFTDLSARVYSTELVRIRAEFVDGALSAGADFTATSADCTLRFTRLWETDRTNGTLTVTVRDRYGLVVAQHRVEFFGIEDDEFDCPIQGLTPGETYSAQAEVVIRNAGADKTASARGTMARAVTNGVWKTSGWIREDAETFVTNRIGSGEWTYDPLAAVADPAEGVIAIDTGASAGSLDCVGFAATNGLPGHTGFQYRSRLSFDTARTEPPDVDGRFGITVVEAAAAGYGDVAEFAFMVLVNGVWTAVDPDVCEPQLGVAYDLTIHADDRANAVTYLIAADGDRWPATLADFISDEAVADPPSVAEFRGVGRVRTLEGDGLDVTVYEISATLDVAAMEPGANFASTVVQGVINMRQVWDKMEKTNGTWTVRIRDTAGRTVAEQSLDYRVLTNQSFRVAAEGLTAGEIYDVQIVADLNDSVVVSEYVRAMAGRKIGGWISETPATFLGEEKGTGLWLQTNGTASVVGTDPDRAIRIDTVLDFPSVAFGPTNESLSVRKSSIREIRANVDFREAGWFVSAGEPELPAKTLAAVTVWCDDSVSVSNREVALAVVSTGGAWKVLEGTRRSSLPEGPVTVYMTIDGKNGLVRYTLATAGSTNLIHQYAIAAKDELQLQVSFAGSGDVRALDGDTWDANLIASATNEFADLDSAIRGSGTDEVLSPLWRAEQLVTVGKGSFRIDDPENWLEVNFPAWYYVVETTEGTYRVYRFNQSNNWIDYAEDGDANVEVKGGVFLVKTAEGLSWIAAKATNEWISGRIELAGDIDLAAHNWTPIAGFSGEFDGRGRTIDGLNNTNLHVSVPGGTYLSGPTNRWGRATYGLFGTATNATLTGVTFAHVAISNLADSVAALAGALAGNCAVSNVTVESGTVCGLGGTVAGLAGFADFGAFLTFVGNTNRADVAGGSPNYGEGRWAAGLLCVAGSADPSAPGALVVTNNVNFGAISNVVYDADLLGGNVAQILAGTTLGAKFGETHLTDNVAAGSVTAALVRSPDNEVAAEAFPAVNLAPAFWGFGSDGAFYRSLDANDPTVVAVDPVRRTARMLSGIYPNGSDYPVGRLNDEISALTNGATVTLSGGLESWGSIRLDRDLTFDLGGFLLYTTYVDSPFVIGEGVKATVTNGEIVVGCGEDETTEVQPFAGDLGSLVTNGLTVTRVPATFYERTILSLDGEPVSALALTETDFAAILNTSGTVIQLYDECGVEIDVDAGLLKVDGKTVAKLSDCYGFKLASGTGKSASFEVRIADSAAPTAGFKLTGGAEGTVTVTVGNAKVGFYYAIQHKGDLASEWVTPAADKWVEATSGDVSITAPKDGEAGFYRVLMSDTLPDK